MAKKYWIVWNDSDNKSEGVIFDNASDAHQASDGNFEQTATAIGEVFHEIYGEDGALEVQKIEL